MVQNYFDYSISLIIRSKTNIDAITDYIGIHPTDSWIIGETRSKSMSGVENNVWIFEKKYRNCTAQDVLGKIALFFEESGLDKKKLAEMPDVEESAIRIFVNTDFAELDWALSPDDIAAIAGAKLSLEISVFSWGGAQDT